MAFFDALQAVLIIWHFETALALMFCMGMVFIYYWTLLILATTLLAVWRTTEEYMLTQQIIKSNLFFWSFRWVLYSWAISLTWVFMLGTIYKLFLTTSETVIVVWFILKSMIVIIGAINYCSTLIIAPDFYTTAVSQNWHLSGCLSWRFSHYKWVSKKSQKIFARVNHPNWKPLICYCNPWSLQGRATPKYLKHVKLVA